MALLGLATAVKKTVVLGADDKLTSTGEAVIWCGFFAMALPACYFWMKTLGKADGGDKKYDVYTTMICTIAALAYLAMATGYGVYTRPFDGREFLFARYIDWTLTTPLMLIDILGLGGAGSDTTNLLIGADILMIVAGLIGALIEGTEKYYFWGFGMLMFAPIIYFLNKFKGESGTTVNKIAMLTIIGWSAYPVVWVLAEGEGIINGDTEAICYTILDFVCKSVFGFIIISARDGGNGTPSTGDGI